MDKARDTGKRGMVRGMVRDIGRDKGRDMGRDTVRDSQGLRPFFLSNKLRRLLIKKESKILRWISL